MWVVYFHIDLDRCVEPILGSWEHKTKAAKNLTFVGALSGDEEEKGLREGTTIEGGVIWNEVGSNEARD
jgi:hypothetical protein